MGCKVNLSDAEVKLIVESLNSTTFRDENSASMMSKLRDKLGAYPDHVLETIEWDVLKWLQDEGERPLIFGLPNRHGEYLITTKSGLVTTDYFDADDGLFENFDLEEIYAVAEMPVGAIKSATRQNVFNPV